VTIKATTKTALYRNNEELRAGVVMYQPGGACFHEETVIQPGNWFPCPIVNCGTLLVSSGTYRTTFTEGSWLQSTRRYS
jgi:hypothetical protein